MRSVVLVAALAALCLVPGAAGSGRGLVYGVTLDDDAGISAPKLAAQTAALAALPSRPMARVVADIGTTPNDFAQSLPAVHRAADVILELGDSSEMRGVAPTVYAAWVRSLTARYARDVDVWEIGNEVNGEWVGSPAAEMARVEAAARAVAAIGGRTMLTLYYNPNCWSKAQNELFTWLAAGRVPPSLERSLDYVTISYYPGDCNGYWPSPSGWQQVFDRLHARFPQASLGFGESGTSCSCLRTAQRLALWQRYRDVRIAGDRYVGLGLWWTWAEDGVPLDGPFWRGFARSL
jgi:hypothetical protein